VTSVRRTKAGELASIDYSEIATDELAAMLDAGERVRECYRVLAKTDDNIVGELLKGQGTFYEWNHYPDGDVYDHDSHSQFYYHAHPGEERPGEHGHFHAFLRPKGMPEGIAPADVADFEPPEDPDDALSHLVAISMDPKGFPIKLFTTNRWVTGEVWYTADNVCALLPYFAIDHAQPSWPVNIWITSMLILFRPQIVRLIRARDIAVEKWARRHPAGNVFEDRGLEVTAELAIDVDRQIAAVRRALAARPNTAGR
jgi:hypothetical protein